MTTGKFKTIVTTAEVEHIEAIIKIAEYCGLTVWTYRDYHDEICRTDCLAFVGAADSPHQDLQDETTLGFIVSRLIKSEDYLQSQILPHEKSLEENSERFDQSAECEILNIGVLPTAQKKGIGQSLLDAVIAECVRRKVKFIWLEVRERNDKALKFYRKNNFVVVRRRKSYYRNPVEDALVMKAELS